MSAPNISEVVERLLARLISDEEDAHGLVRHHFPSGTLFLEKTDDDIPLNLPQNRQVFCTLFCY
jgi:hypothetical protein